MFVGRRDQFAELVEALSASRSGEGSIVLLSGSAAAGKTAILQKFQRASVESAAAFLKASGSTQERGLRFGVMRQLLMRMRVPSAACERARALLDEGLRALDEAHADPAAGDRVMFGLCEVVLALSEAVPVVVVVDDVHEADAESLRCLNYLARRVSTARVMVVLTERSDFRMAYAGARAGFTRQPLFREIRLRGLTTGEVRELMAAELGEAVADSLAEECARVSGGNPLLATALVEDLAAAPGEDRRLVTGESFGFAVVDCLQRLNPESTELAHRLAVYGAEASTLTLGQSCARVTARTVTELRAVGLVTDRGFRSPAAAAAVRAEVPAEDVARYHREAAVLLRDAGAEPRLIADHLMAAGQPEPWAVGLLQEAAQTALDAFDFAGAVGLFEAAHRASTDPGQAARLLLWRSRAAWQVDPVLALSRLPELTAALEAGQLPVREASSLIKDLFWHGCIDEAARVLELAVDLSAASGEDDVAEIHYLRTWLSAMCPPLLERAFPEPEAAPPAEARRPAVPANVAADTRLQAATTLSSVFKDGPVPSAVSGAEHVLERSPLGPVTLEHVNLALMALFYADELDRAQAWCEELFAEARSRAIPTWEAVLVAFRAQIHIVSGDLHAAETDCAHALEWLAPRSWGLGIGRPLASSVYALTAMGRYEEAQARLAQPVPEAMFQTPFGQQYLYARGYYLLATGRFRAAHGDFMACGQSLQRWGIDPGTVVPWRTATAEAWLALGEPKRAVPLLEKELALHGASRPRIHGKALRLLAGTVEPRRRLQMLRQAVTGLEACGGKLELAYALADLGRTHHVLGQSSRARMVIQRAYRLAKQCSAEPLCCSLLPEVQTGEEEAQPRAVTAGPPALAPSEEEALTEAEQRVAVLAAEGHTNREIARRLYVTVSTVEQHLTKIFRKLNVARRSDLPLLVTGEKATRSLASYGRPAMGW
ncbi:AAA family ATPase [Kitasatospora sp. NPDC092286]|uniref:helix-turn-helix transcriptional regulator n=1 Tax=Kitasatospora sp. NPDC092286 TaxID=3364087 RepID=UPI0037FEFB46